MIESLQANPMGTVIKLPSFHIQQVSSTIDGMVESLKSEGLATPSMKSSYDGVLGNSALKRNYSSLATDQTTNYLSHKSFYKMATPNNAKVLRKSKSQLKIPNSTVEGRKSQKLMFFSPKAVSQYERRSHRSNQGSRNKTANNSNLITSRTSLANFNKKNNFHPVLNNGKPAPQNSLFLTKLQSQTQN